MEATIQKKATMFRLNVDLVDRLKEMARREHRSLNNFVECILLNVAYNEPLIHPLLKQCSNLWDYELF